MAVEVIPGNGRLVLALEDNGSDGRKVVRSKSFANLKPTAADADVYAVGQALGALQAKTVVAIKRVSEVELIESV